MNKYFFKIIMKNKYTKLLVLVFIFICVIVTLQLREDVHEYSYDDYVFKYKSEVIDNTRILKRDKYNARHADTTLFNTTPEGDVALLQYDIWKVKISKELLAMLEDSQEITDDFLEAEKKYEILKELCEIQSCISVPNGDEPIEKACEDEMKKYADYLSLEELSFSFKDLAYCGQGTLDRELSEAHDNLILQAKIVFDKIDNRAVNYGESSPFVFLAMLFGDLNLTPILINISLLLYAMGVVICWKENGEYRCKINVNQSDFKMFARYNGCLLISSMLLILGAIVFFFIIWGFLGDFSGFTSRIMCDADNFNSIVNFAHEDDFQRIGLSKVFYDYVDYFWSFTIHNYQLVDFRLFLVAAVCLGFLKIFFYILLGAGVGFVFSSRVKAVICGIVLSTMVVIGNFILKPSGVNPFTIGSCWNITLGGYGITWLNAVLLLAACIVILYVFFNIVIKLKDTE